MRLTFWTEKAVFESCERSNLHLRPGFNSLLIHVNKVNKGGGGSCTSFQCFITVLLTDSSPQVLSMFIDGGHLTLILLQLLQLCYNICINVYMYAADQQTDRNPCSYRGAHTHLLLIFITNTLFY